MISVFSNFLDPYIEAGLLQDVDQTKIRTIYEELRIAYNQGAGGISSSTRLFVPFDEENPDDFDDDLYYKLRSNKELYDLIQWFNLKFILEYPDMRYTTIHVRVKIFKSKLQKLINQGIVDNEVAAKLYLNLIDSLRKEDHAMFLEQTSDLPF